MHTNHVALMKQIASKIVSLKNQVIVIKLSEIVISNIDLLNNFATNVRLLITSGVRVLIVHEYENIVKTKFNELFKNFNNDIKYTRFNHDKLSKIVEMIIYGRINRDIISKLHANSLSAMGFSGKDGNLIVAQRYANSRLAYVGKPILVNPELLFLHDNDTIVSVISPVAFDDKLYTTILDTNLTAAMIASHIEADHLIMMEDKNFFTNNDITLHSTSELQDILYRNHEIHPHGSEIIAVKYALQNSQCFVHFLNSNIADVILLKLCL